MRRYSVWNPSAGAWDYYSAQGELRAGVIAPTPRLRGNHRLGFTPEEAARALPVGATLIGHGPQAVGMVAGRNQALGIMGLELDSLVRVALFGGVAYLVWKHWLSKR